MSVVVFSSSSRASEHTALQGRDLERVPLDALKDLLRSSYLNRRSSLHVNSLQRPETLHRLVTGQSIPHSAGRRSTLRSSSGISTVFPSMPYARSPEAGAGSISALPLRAGPPSVLQTPTQPRPVPFTRPSVTARQLQPWRSASSSRSTTKSSVSRASTPSPAEHPHILSAPISSATHPTATAASSPAGVSMPSTTVIDGDSCAHPTQHVPTGSRAPSPGPVGGGVEDLVNSLYYFPDIQSQAGRSALDANPIERVASLIHPGLLEVHRIAPAQSVSGVQADSNQAVGSQSGVNVPANTEGHADVRVGDQNVRGKVDATRVLDPQAEENADTRGNGSAGPIADEQVDGSTGQDADKQVHEPAGKDADRESDDNADDRADEGGPANLEEDTGGEGDEDADGETDREGEDVVAHASFKTSTGGDGHVESGGHQTVDEYGLSEVEEHPSEGTDDLPVALRALLVRMAARDPSWGSPSSESQVQLSDFQAELRSDVSWMSPDAGRPELQDPPLGPSIDEYQSDSAAWDGAGMTLAGDFENEREWRRMYMDLAGDACAIPIRLPSLPPETAKDAPASDHTFSDDGASYDADSAFAVPVDPPGELRQAAGQAEVAVPALLFDPEEDWWPTLLVWHGRGDVAALGLDARGSSIDTHSFALDLLRSIPMVYDCQQRIVTAPVSVVIHALAATPRTGSGGGGVSFQCTFDGRKFFRQVAGMPLIRAPIDQLGRRDRRTSIHVLPLSSCGNWGTGLSGRTGGARRCQDVFRRFRRGTGSSFKSHMQVTRTICGKTSMKRPRKAHRYPWMTGRGCGSAPSERRISIGARCSTSVLSVLNLLSSRRWTTGCAAALCVRMVAPRR
ncbi:hypothetical protein C8T65DRAFT_829186 [Cerioporus squamosus]|nr:hypothetical protein C8T65DRAFT_829186 [Cerioporus squamosus]